MLMTIGETARYMKVSDPTVRKAIRSRGLGIVRFGRSIRINKDQLDAWIEDNTQHIGDNGAENKNAPAGES